MKKPPCRDLVLQGGVCHSRVIWILPVSVRISQTPPDVVFGTSTRPTPESVRNTFSESRLPATFPVSVFTWISPASQPVKATCPVLRSIESCSAAITRSSRRFPTLPPETRFRQETPHSSASPVVTCTVRSSRHVTSVTRTAPVVAERSSAPTAVSAARILPVLVRIAAAPETDAERSALPVVREISAC